VAEATRTVSRSSRSARADRDRARNTHHWQRERDRLRAIGRSALIGPFPTIYVNCRVFRIAGCRSKFSPLIEGDRLDGSGFDGSPFYKAGVVASAVLIGIPELQQRTSSFATPATAEANRIVAEMEPRWPAPARRRPQCRRMYCRSEGRHESGRKHGSTGKGGGHSHLPARRVFPGDSFHRSSLPDIVTV
jgi:hypothetical protein